MAGVVGANVLVIMVMLASQLQPVQGQTNADDVHGLLSFHKSLNSPLVPGWNFSGGDPCRESWQGITCDGMNVTEIRLTGLGLHGSLGWSSSLDKFRHLTVLDLSNNKLEGTIPYNLPINVQLLNLQRNHLRQTIPWSLGQLLSLTELRLAHNNLSGSISDNFSKLHSLITLDLSDNSFSGNVPRSLRNLSKLSFVYLADNQLSSGLEFLTSLRLQALDIRKNAFGGEIPTQLMGIPSFQYSGNDFNGSFPFSHFNVSLPHDHFNLSTPHAIAPSVAPTPSIAPAALALSHPPEKAPTKAPSKNHTKSLPPKHHKTTSSPHHLNGTTKSREAQQNESFWSRPRIAGVAVVGVLAIVTAVLTFLLFKWRHVPDVPQKEDTDVPWLELRSLYTCQKKNAVHA